MNYDAAIDLSFIPRAMNEVERQLHKAQVAKAKGDSAKERERLLDAGAKALVALRQLRGLRLWDQLREERQRRIEGWRDLVLPATGDLLEAMGYRPPPPANEFIDPGNAAMRRAVGIPDPGQADPVTEAETAIGRLEGEFESLLDGLKRSTDPQTVEKLKNGIRATCTAFRREAGRTLVACLVVPAVQEGVRRFGPYAADLLHELLRHAEHVLPSLSMALVTRIAVPDDDTRQLREARGVRQVDGPRNIESPPTTRRALTPEFPPDESQPPSKIGREGERTRSALGQSDDDRDAVDTSRQARNTAHTGIRGHRGPGSDRGGPNRAER
jgi:hypothetical protein